MAKEGSSFYVTIGNKVKRYIPSSSLGSEPPSCWEKAATSSSWNAPLISSTVMLIVADLSLTIGFLTIL